MIEIIDKTNCCGCNACGDICPKKAIAFETDREGFWYPVIDKALCVNCGLCNKVCPIENIGSLKHNDLEESVCYAAEHKNIEVVFDSTSGGLFSALADSMYSLNGYVGGAIFNPDFSVKHYISNKKEDLAALRSSKYLQSNLEGFYRQVKILCDNGEKVLVCGTPCQMVALRAFLNKDYENLIIIDFICRGINSPNVWRKYLDSFEERYGSPVVYAKAKSKEYGWRNLTQKVILANSKSYYETGSESLYTKGYLQTNAYCRPSCYICRFKGFPRISDITLADFWGIERFNKEPEKDLGTSLVMINSRKGLRYFESAKKRINCISMPFSSILKGNPALIKPIDPPKVNRDEFFEYLEHHTFSEIAERYAGFTINCKKSAQREIVQRLYRYYRLNGCNIFLLLKTMYINHEIGTGIFSICRKAGIIPTNHSLIAISKKAKIEINGIVSIGDKKFRHSTWETRLLVEQNAKLVIESDCKFGYGSDIEVFENAELHIGGRSRGVSSVPGSNCNTTIICAQNISIGNDVMIGRNVTIRDNNGNHYINLPGYKNSRPVIIGDKVWLCEGCVIMPGVKIGDGAIVGAGSVVFSNVPAYTLVSGNPAKIVEQNILWKY
jgi:coenzyme F420-reducing hydrogenase beta subunit/acyl-[acyl carrier protein]--UDP-N-acetylglucosamine O-acyltransferase